MKINSVYPWLVADMVLFFAINYVVITTYDPFILFSQLSVLEFIILGLAVYRTANIISNEYVTKPFRAYFVAEVEENGKKVESPIHEGFRGFVGNLIYCPSCTGVWFAMILTYSYLLWPQYASPIILFLALSGCERFFAYIAGRIKNK